MDATRVYLGSGIRLFDRIDANRVSLEIVRSINCPMVTHLMYAVRRKAQVQPG